MQSSGLTGSFKEAADANKDGKITTKVLSQFTFFVKKMSKFDNDY